MLVHGKQYRLAFIAAFGAFALLNSSASAQRGGQLTIPAPSITEYKPHSTLVVPEHKVPRAKFPAVDFHGHPPALTSADNIKTVIDDGFVTKAELCTGAYAAACTAAGIS